MRRGLHVIALVMAYAVASWVLGAAGTGLPPLGGPELLAALGRPFVRAAPAPADDLVSSPERAGALDVAQLFELPPPAADARPGEPAADAGGGGRPTFADFAARLGELARGERTKVRVAHLGDSEIVGDGVSGTLREAFAARYGDGGLGFSLVVAPFSWYGRRGWEHSAGRDFVATSFVFGTLPDGGYGPGGVAFMAHGPGAEAGVKLLVGVGEPCTLGLHYWAEPESKGLVELLFDGVFSERLAFADTPAGERVKRVHFDACPRKLEVKSRGYDQHRVFGWSMERDAPGIVWSSLGTISSQLPHFAHYTDDSLAEALAALEPDLLVVSYDLNFSDRGIPKTYEGEARTELERLRRAAPGAACLVTGPYPLGPPFANNVATPLRDVVLALDAAQRSAALAAGCGYVDRIRLAGGYEAAKRWSAVRPALMSGDYRHLTPEGAERMGRALARLLFAQIDGSQAAAVAPELDVHPVPQKRRRRSD